MKGRRRWTGKAITGAVIVAVDQITKAAIREHVPVHDTIAVIPGFLNLTHVLNTGVAYGVLNEYDFPYKSVVVALIAGAALAAIAFYAATYATETRLARWSLTLVIAGAVGNLIDRIVGGAVVDFVDVYWRQWHFWAFNVADACITIGAILLIVDMFRTGSHVPQAS